MADLDNALQQLRNERRRTTQVKKLESAIWVLEELIRRNSTSPYDVAPSQLAPEGHRSW